MSEEHFTLVNDLTFFLVLDSEIELLRDETVYGMQTVAFIDGVVHYMQDEPVSLETAINLWQDMNDRLLTHDEFNQVDVENSIRLEED